MDFKFIVLALVISLAAGEAAKNTESPVIRTNDKGVELNKNEELPVGKDNVTSEKLTHSVTNVVEGKGNDLPHQVVIHKQKSSADAIAAENGTVTDAPSPAPSPVTTLIPTHAPTPTPAPTSAPTTTSNPNTTTTAALVTTTTTAKPTVPPVPEEGNWTVSESGKVCIAMQMEIEFNITYPGSKDAIYNKTIYVPKSADATGHCGKSKQDITLEWGSGNILAIYFNANSSTGKFYINSLNLTVNTTDFKNIKENVTNLTYVSTKVPFPVVPVNMSYRCDKQLEQKLQGLNNSCNATLLVRHTQFQAFMGDKAVFGEVKDCDEFDTPDIVPIAVGCVLSILVLIVLAAYLIGRRRSQSRGYLSM